MRGIPSMYSQSLKQNESEPPIRVVFAADLSPIRTREQASASICSTISISPVHHFADFINVGSFIFSDFFPKDIDNASSWIAVLVSLNWLSIAPNMTTNRDRNDRCRIRKTLSDLILNGSPVHQCRWGAVLAF